MGNSAFSSCFEELKEKYRVPHLLDKNTRVLFVLESPHVDELVHGAPVSGLSGKAMSKVIFEQENKKAFGMQVKEDTANEENVLGIGIINICPIPMQRIAYQHEKVEALYGEMELGLFNDFFDCLEKVRVNPKKKNKDAKKEFMQQIVLEDFKKMINTLKEQPLVIIPCGNTAAVFWNLANVFSEHWEVIEGVPHPSFGNWHKIKYREKIEEIKNIVRKVSV